MQSVFETNEADTAAENEMFSGEYDDDGDSQGTVVEDGDVASSVFHCSDAASDFQTSDCASDRYFAPFSGHFSHFHSVSAFVLISWMHLPRRAQKEMTLRASKT